MFTTPVLFLVFNRPATTKKVLAQIRKIKPAFLYIAADGPRADKPGEAAICAEVKNIILSHIDWDCEVKTLFRENNLGCKHAVSQAINWFFLQEEMGIILEDDCMPNLSFFPFAQQMLEKYKDDDTIIAINGCNFGFDNHEASYLFSRYMNVWGWATWRRVSAAICYDIPDWNQKNKISFLRSRLKRQMIDLDLPWFEYWRSVFDMLTNGDIDTWDFYWIYYQFLNKKKNIIPAKNLIRNIGFSEHATHTTLLTHPASNLQTIELHFPLIHPKRKEVNIQYEERVLKPICYMYNSKANFFYIKNMILKIPGIAFISKTFKVK